MSWGEDGGGGRVLPAKLCLGMTGGDGSVAVEGEVVGGGGLVVEDLLGVVGGQAAEGEEAQ